jgi:hypothetical protein
MATSRDIITKIKLFEPQDENWLELDDLLNDLWSTGEQEAFTADLFNVFERFPDDDGAGVLWSIVHGVERFKTYDRELVESLRRQPSMMGFAMIIRMKNSGANVMGGVEFDALLTELLNHERTLADLKDDIIKMMKRFS